VCYCLEHAVLLSSTSTLEKGTYKEDDAIGEVANE
jgi:hypothetical protein